MPILTSRVTPQLCPCIKILIMQLSLNKASNQHLVHLITFLKWNRKLCVNKSIGTSHLAGPDPASFLWVLPFCFFARRMALSVFTLISMLWTRSLLRTSICFHIPHIFFIASRVQKPLPRSTFTGLTTSSVFASVTSEILLTALATVIICVWSYFLAWPIPLPWFSHLSITF